MRAPGSAVGSAVTDYRVSWAAVGAFESFGGVEGAVKCSYIFIILAHDRKIASAAETEAAAASSMAESRRIEVLAASIEKFPAASPIRVAMEAELQNLLGISATSTCSDTAKLDD